ncbi:MAG TPA: ABC transporter permease [Bryobacteraceae bacterium]|nr:ABC transporter permease [Bryobacteraceae bacterium]
MHTYLAQKLIAPPLILLLASLLIFSAVRLLPGDPARLMAGMQADQVTVESVRHRLGFDQPFPVQYGRFLERALRGDLGQSTRSQQPVAREIAERLPYTVALTTVSYGVAILFGLAAGVLAAVYRGSWLDSLVMLCAISGASVANFWVALMAMDLFAVKLGWLPLMGAGEWRSYVLPAATLALAPTAVIARMTRGSMLEIIHQDYIRTARAKGLGDAKVYLKHALRNALVPIVTIVGMNFAALLGGAVITESVFNWPGVGRLLVDAVRYRDYPTIQGITLITVLFVVVINLAADLAVGFLNPRIRFD